jgi:hypothetical protein
MRNREEEAGFWYEEGAKAVRAGGHGLKTLAGHLIFMIDGTSEFAGPLWPVRILHDRREFRLERFVDYLRKPTRMGLGLPSLHFLRHVLEATPKDGERALALVRAELAREGVDFDAAADSERDAELVKRKLGGHGGDRKSEENKYQGRNPILKTRGRDYDMVRLSRDRPDLAKRVVVGELSANAAAIEAGFRRKPVKRCPKCGHEW